MRIYVNSNDTTASRYASSLSYITDTGLGYAITLTEDGLTISAQAGTGEVLEDIDHVALVIAQIAYVARDMSLVVHSTHTAPPSRNTRGDEHRAADIYPPGRHPRIVVDEGVN